MNTQVPFVITPKSINVMLDEKMHAIDDTHPFFDDVRNALKGDHDLDKIRELVSIPDAIEGRTFGKVTVTDDAIYYKNESVNNEMTKRMIDMISQGFNVEMWALFMDNLMSNPIESAREELYLWLENSGMPITPDGHFIAFKKVRDDYASYHRDPRGQLVSNRPGDLVQMADEDVDRSRNSTCSTGLHFCSKEYLPSYYGNEGRVVILKINPADVRAIPSDYGNAKGRAFQYLVVGELDEADTRTAFGKTPVATGYGDHDFETIEDEVPHGFDEFEGQDDEENGNIDSTFLQTPVTEKPFTPKTPKASKPKGKKKTRAKQRHGGKWTSHQLMRLVKRVGSVRAAAKAEGVAKSTMQDWVKKAKEEIGEK